MAADISIRMPVEPQPRELQFLDQLHTTGVDSTRVTETVSMASTGRGVPMLVSVKGVDFSKYPFYGQLDLDPAGTRLDKSSVAVSDELLQRLGIHLGDTIEIGQENSALRHALFANPIA